jgi:hypothetical protein
MPPTIGRLQVSENLILEQVSATNGENIDSAVAYIAVEAPSETNYFLTARDQMDFFLFIYCLVSGKAVTEKIGIGTFLDNIASLGAKRVGFSNYERINVIGEHEDSIFSKPILDAKKLFLQLVPERQQIMESPLGLSLTYYYLAVRASERVLQEAIINLMIAAEALLVTNDKKITYSISKRLSALIAKNEEERTEIFEKMRKLYRLRCDIVHGKGGKVSIKDVQILFGYVRRAIEEGISFRHISKQELVTKLDNRSDFSS